MVCTMVATTLQHLTKPILTGVIAKTSLSSPYYSSFSHLHSSINQSFFYHGPKSILSPIILTYSIGTASLIRTQQNPMWVSQHLSNSPTFQPITFPPHINFEKFPWNQLWFILWYHHFQLEHLAVNSDLSSFVPIAAAPVSCVS